MLLLTEQLRGDREPPELSEARSKIVFQRLLLPLFLQNQSNHLQRGDGKVGCFRVREIRHFKIRMIEMKGGNINIKGSIREKNQELNPGRFQQANVGNHSVTQHRSLSCLQLLVMLFTVYVTSRITVCMTHTFCQASSIVQVVPCPERIPAHAWSPVMVTPSRFMQVNELQFAELLQVLGKIASCKAIWSPNMDMDSQVI